MLIRSDGHPNVVRYYTKEVQNDFVYLGLQLCDMTLKYAHLLQPLRLFLLLADFIFTRCLYRDFILNVKSKSSPKTAISAKDGEQGAASDITISDELKGSLLQVSKLCPSVLVICITDMPTTPASRLRMVWRTCTRSASCTAT